MATKAAKAQVPFGHVTNTGSRAWPRFQPIGMLDVKRLNQVGSHPSTVATAAERPRTNNT